QILNVYRSGTLLQHIESAVNHEAGRNVPVAHDVRIEAASKLAEILALGDFGKGTDSTRAKRNAKNPEALAEGRLVIPANSSHHQSADLVGDGLKIVARSEERRVGKECRVRWGQCAV